MSEPEASFACLCVEPDEEFSGKGDAHDHFGFSLIEEALPEVSEAWIELAGD